LAAGAANAPQGRGYSINKLRSRVCIHSCLILRLSEFQASGKIKPIALDAFAYVEVMNPARVEIEVTFANLRGVRNDRANAKSAPPKATEHGGRRASVVGDLLYSTLHKANAESILEPFDN
jgi:hypothetical protein